MARGFNYGLDYMNPAMPKPGGEPQEKPADAPSKHSGKSKKSHSHSAPPPVAPPPAAPPPIPPVVSTVQNLGGKLNGFVGNLLEQDDWWVWTFFFLIFFTPDFRKRLFDNKE